MLVIGLTGGIGSGKSTAANYFAELGIEIIDADIIARELVTPNSNILKTIVSHFGQEVLQEDGNLNRSYLRGIIFANPTERLWLEALLHPLIRQRIEKKIAQAQSPYVIVVVPLLIETNYTYPLDRILVIDTPEDLQSQRTKMRDNLSQDELNAIINSQSNRQQRLAAANDIIYNDKGLDDLQKQVIELHQFYLTNPRH